MKALLFILLFFTFFNIHAQVKDSLAVVFSPLGGKYDTSQEIILAAPEGSTIYYTLDGSRPSSASFRYKKPIKVETVSVIRAVAYINGHRSTTVTQSYFCDRSYSLPIISIVTAPEKLWDYESGIYVKGCCADTTEPYRGANFWQDWEVSANIEMYETNGKLCFNQKVGINLFGGFSRMLPQKSLAIFARSRYGKNRIKYPIFPDRNEDSYKSFIIRNSGGDFKRTHLRDAFMTQLAAPTGVAIQAYRPVVVFLNGAYWGIQNLREKISEHYLKSNFGVDKNNVDILRQNGILRHGSSRNYKKLLQFLRSQDMTADSTILALRKFMDVDDFIRYNIAEVYSDNRDAGGNIRYWRERNDSAKWRWIFYDLDMGLGNNNPKGYKRNTLKKFTQINQESWPDPSWSTFIIRSLLKNDKLKIQYINTFADHLNTVYKEETAVRLLNTMQDHLREEMSYHVKRWGTSYTNWEHHVDIVRTFVKERPNYLRKFIVEKFDLEGTLNVKVVVPKKEVGSVSFNKMPLKSNFEGVYFQGIPVTVTAQPTHDYVFKGWVNRPEKTNTISVTDSTDLVIEPIFEPRPKSDFYDHIIFNEICFYQTPLDSSSDWIELYNRSENSVNISNWVFTKTNYENGFVIGDKLKIPSKSYLILARNKEKYSTKYSIDTIDVIGDFDFGLSKSSEHIKLYDNNGNIVDSLSYFQNKPLDSTHTISLLHPDSLTHTFTSWKIEPPNPGDKSLAFKKYLKDEEDKRYWTKIYYIGGGSFFFILAGGILLLLFFRKKQQRNTKE